MRLRLLLLALPALVGIPCASASAQTRLNPPSHYCAFSGVERLAEDLYIFPPDSDAINALKLLMDQVGLAPNFALNAANVPNAVAMVDGSTRRILYSQEFMLNVEATSPEGWVSRAILAHEIGHHLQGHTLEAQGRAENELQADYYAGFVLHGMGASLAQTRAAIEQYANEFATATHPSRSARLAAITNGWTAARQLRRRPPNGPARPDTVPQRPVEEDTTTVPGTVPGTARYVSRAVFPADPNSYFITSNNDIVGQSPMGQVMLVGKKVPPTLPGFAWMYWTPYGSYGVDVNGRIWGWYPNGVTYQVGYITNP